MTDEAVLPLSRPIDVSTIRPDGLPFQLSATADEKAALAKAFDIPALAALEADLKLEKKGPRVHVTGRVYGRFTQICVVSLDPFESDFDEAVSVDFDEDPAKAHKMHPDDEIPDPIINGEIDLGMLAAEFAALALDPYPRKPGVVFDFRDPRDTDNTPPSPFGALAALKPKS
jgi:uncharacterized metal-binding protein YceD (DUF177 family)